MGTPLRLWRRAVDAAGIIWTLAALTLIALAGVVLYRKHGLEPLGFYRINDFAVEKVRHAAIAACKSTSITGLVRKDAENLLSEVARHAIAQTFAEIYPQRPFKVTPDWPRADVIISGNIAVIDLWIGHDYMDDGEGIKPVNVEINRQATLKLDGRRPLKAALSEVFDGPDGTLKAKPAPPSEPQKLVARQGAKPIPPGMKR